MNDVVERVARAICVAMGDDPDREGPDWAAEAYGSVARAAIEAMREPTEAMLLAAHNGPLLAMGHEMGIEQRKWLTDMWSAMLSAALADASLDGERH